MVCTWLTRTRLYINTYILLHATRAKVLLGAAAHPSLQYYLRHIMPLDNLVFCMRMRILDRQLDSPTFHRRRASRPRALVRLIGYLYHAPVLRYSPSPIELPSTTCAKRRPACQPNVGRPLEMVTARGGDIALFRRICYVTFVTPHAAYQY